ncbi:hypothetical protein ABS71_06360 [bacterium SCN 62-11]|nr:MAG: hypothetical protein ABS71_06360 [bacterium SCN 62-11]
MIGPLLSGKQFAKYALPVLMISPGRFVKAMTNLRGQDGQRDDLRVGMLQRSACGRSVILEDDHVLDTGLLRKEPVAFAPGLQNQSNLEYRLEG